jgi:hypothetical protein
MKAQISAQIEMDGRLPSSVPGSESLQSTIHCLPGTIVGRWEHMRVLELSATLEFGADPTFENEATGSSVSSLPGLGF